MLNDSQQKILVRRFIASVLISCCGLWPVQAQPSVYSTANAHAHNDYENPRPFYTACENGFGSIEADIFLVKGDLIVAHDTIEVGLHRTLVNLYLKPLDSVLSAHHGYPYADTTRKLQILIDVKSEAANTLKQLVRTLTSFPALIHNRSLRWVISGNRPPQSAFARYPSFIWFDGIPANAYETPALEKIVMMSDDFKRYSNWNGRGEIPPADKAKLEAATSKAHAQKKTVRFWDAPDGQDAWMLFAEMKVDYINTDHIPELAAFLKTVQPIKN